MHSRQQSLTQKFPLISQVEGGPVVDLRTGFLTPHDIVASPHLTPAEKAFLLRDWAYDACELAVAEEEGMNGGVASEVYSVMSALNELTQGFDVGHTGPTKHAALAVR